MKIIEGDLLKLALNKEFDVIIHGCNCYCSMGAGIAQSVKKIFPEAFEVDEKTINGSKEKMGTISYAKVFRNTHEIIIVNAYTQYHWKGKGVLVDYDAIKSVMKIISKKFYGKRIAYPMIGAGLAGGDWNIISKIIDSALKGEDHTLVKFKP